MMAGVHEERFNDEIRLPSDCIIRFSFVIYSSRGGHHRYPMCMHIKHISNTKQVKHGKQAHAYLPARSSRRLPAGISPLLPAPAHPPPTQTRRGFPGPARQLPGGMCKSGCVVAIIII